ncbi:hypothetical protein amb0921 [Paramagnetospirillum magneticum AMB-1]|uniref:Uncharacterized protein n=1 Tax=Paramagnetospirillum magneticum (strain ATCC 700264 / AMB-1) TaxID=342108 RepID=Q2W8V0_PARM1|nr:hypothetical protein amb0921 [Paramagnetospirillum magneticum AMB-1]
MLSQLLQFFSGGNKFGIRCGECLNSFGQFQVQNFEFVAAFGQMLFRDFAFCDVRNDADQTRTPIFVSGHVTGGQLPPERSAI